MYKSQRGIKERISQLENIIKEKEKSLKGAPKGILNIARAGTRVQYYYKSDSKDKKRKYIKKTDETLIKNLCQKDYDERVLELARKELFHLRNLYALSENGLCDDIYMNLHADRKCYVTPIELPDEEFVEQWQHQEYEKKGFSPNAPEYYTEKGERVRSKSEILIANTLCKHGIPYRYEVPLYLNGFGLIHPDFTVLNVKERKEYYYEHLGKMDDLEYIDKALKRIDAYERNGILLGKNLILTYETLSHPINLKHVELMIEQYLK